MTQNASFWKPGNIVKLKEPYKPGHPPASLYQTLLPALSYEHRQYREWEGFTYGIIVQELAHDGPYTHVSLHLYNPDLGLIYGEGPTQVPTYVDFRSDELIPYRDATHPNYKLIEQ